MAYSSKFSLALLLASMTISMVSAQSLPTLPVNALSLTGGLFACTPTGIPSPGIPALPGINIHVACNSGTIDLGTLVTNLAGAIDGVFKTINATLFTPSVCVATITLPILECQLFPPTGILRTNLNFVGIPLVGGPVIQVVPVTWTPAPAA